MEIDITKHISEDTMREIAIEEWRGMCRRACEGNAERILSNLGYQVAERMVSEALGENADQLIRDKAVEVIGKLSEFTVFRKPDAWDRSGCHAYTVLTNAIRDNASLVNEMVAKAIKQISKREALDVLKSGTIQINPTPTP